MKKWIALCALLVAPISNASNELSAQVRFLLPDNVKSVEAAVTHFIEPFGYEVQMNAPAPAESIDILHQSIAASLPKRGSLVTIKEAILAVVPKNVHLIIDEKAKLIAFEQSRDEK